MKSKLKINLTLGGILNKTSLLAAAALLVLAGVANAQNNEFGTGAGNSTTTGVNNTAYGHQALYFNTTGIYNAANGCYALYSNTTGIGNTAMAPKRSAPTRPAITT